MIKAIINGIMSLVIGLVNILLKPIDLLINQFLPGLDNAFSVINNFFDMLGDVVPWLISYTGLSSVLISTIVDILVFILTVPIMIEAIKLAIRWYDKLKL